MSARRFVFAAAAAIICVLFAPMIARAGEEKEPVGVGKWLTFVSNLDGGYRRTQFFAAHYDTAVFQWDSRAELWLPPFRKEFSWGPYIRVAGIAGSQGDAWQNGWLGGPGLGFQVYPISMERFREPHSVAGKLFGPLRFFAEYNFTNYWGQLNRWRPRNQARIGFDYWKASNVNDPAHSWWAEVWNGLYWQSSNEFTDRYDSVIFANSARIGIRKPRSGAISTITPYLAAESSRTKYDYAGTKDCVFPVQYAGSNPCDFYWENRLLVGGGFRFAPSLNGLNSKNRTWLTRFVIYGEYMNTVAYYGPTAPPSVPRFDVRIGVSASIGDWYK